MSHPRGAELADVLEERMRLFLAFHSRLFPAVLVAMKADLDQRLLLAIVGRRPSWARRSSGGL